MELLTRSFIILVAILNRIWDQNLLDENVICIRVILDTHNLFFCHQKNWTTVRIAVARKFIISNKKLRLLVYQWDPCSFPIEIPN